VDTVNTKSAQIARILHQATTPTMGGVRVAGGFVAYGFDEFVDTVLPMARAQLQALSKQREATKKIEHAQTKARAALKERLVVVTGAVAGDGQKKSADASR
jgi:hypothetical protein